jgi:hypothetical protein
MSLGREVDIVDDHLFLRDEGRKDDFPATGYVQYSVIDSRVDAEVRQNGMAEPNVGGRLVSGVPHNNGVSMHLDGLTLWRPKLDGGTVGKIAYEARALLEVVVQCGANKERDNRGRVPCHERPIHRVPLS